MPIPKIAPEQRVLRYIREHRLIARGQKVLVAVSGGPDSVCLLHILSSLGRELDIELHIAHLNHGLRGKESLADAAYVAGLARKLGIPATIASRDVRLFRKQHGLSLEEAAREVRYAFLAEAAAKTGAGRVAVGHTASDHVETILMHLIRGSGIRGLRGLLPVTTRPAFGTTLTVIRPLLELKREDTAAYCRRHRLHPRHDTSNASLEPFRNRIRHELLPLLRDYNPGVDEALRRTASFATADLDFIDKELTRVKDKIMRREGEVVSLDKKRFLALPETLQRYLLRGALELLLGSLQDIEAGHIADILAALEKPAGKVIGLPEGLYFTVEYDRYVLAPGTVSPCPFSVLDKEYPLKVPGKTKLPGGVMLASVTTVAASSGNIKDTDNFTACFDLEKTGTDLAVRRRLESDRFQPLGLKSPKKLNAFMIDARIPRSWRARIPIVTAPGQIIWVCGWRIDERVKVTAATKKMLRLEFKRY